MYHRYYGYHYLSTRTNLLIDAIVCLGITIIADIAFWILCLPNMVGGSLLPFTIGFTVYSVFSLITCILVIISVSNREKHDFIGILALFFLLIITGVIYLFVYGTERERMVDNRNAKFREYDKRIYGSLLGVEEDPIDMDAEDIDVEIDVDDFLEGK